MDQYDVVIIGSGPAGLAAAFGLLKHSTSSGAAPLRIAVFDKAKTSTGGLRNDCKMNFTYPVGFPEDIWNRDSADAYLDMVKEDLHPGILARKNLTVYRRRGEPLGVQLLEVDQAHLGTDGGLKLIQTLTAALEKQGVDIFLGEEMTGLDEQARQITTTTRTVGFEYLLIAPGRGGFKFLQDTLDTIGVNYVDHIVDIGIRIETRIEHYPIVHDYYDPKFLFPGRVRTFCTNSGDAHVVQERYLSRHGKTYYSVNGHAYSHRNAANGLVNFAMLKTIRFTEPLASGQEFAENLGLQAMLMGGGHPIMQRVGDFRMGKRSKHSSFSGDLYDFEPTLRGCTPGDISLSMPAKILRDIWKSMKALDTIIPGILHPSTIMYYPEIKLYANRPVFSDSNFKVKDRIYLAGDGAGTSRGITAAWASGLRACFGILKDLGISSPLPD